MDSGKSGGTCLTGPTAHPPLPVCRQVHDCRAGFGQSEERGRVVRGDGEEFGSYLHRHHVPPHSGRIHR